MRFDERYDDELIKNGTNIIKRLESLCSDFDMDVTGHITVSGYAGFVTDVTEKSNLEFGADFGVDTLLMNLVKGGETIRWKIRSSKDCMTEFEDDLDDLRYELEKAKKENLI